MRVGVTEELSYTCEIHFQNVENSFFQAKYYNNRYSNKDGLSLIMKASFFSGVPLRNIADDTCEPKRAVKDDVSTKDWPTAALEQMLNAIARRKLAYKTAFIALSVVTLLTFYPLPQFDFLFLFIYCNFLIILITFWVWAPFRFFISISCCPIFVPNLRLL